MPRHGKHDDGNATQVKYLEAVDAMVGQLLRRLAQAEAESSGGSVVEPQEAPVSCARRFAVRFRLMSHTLFKVSVLTGPLCMVCHSIQTVSSHLKLSWNTGSSKAGMHFSSQTIEVLSCC